MSKLYLLFGGFAVAGTGTGLGVYYGIGSGQQVTKSQDKGQEQDGAGRGGESPELQTQEVVGQGGVSSGPVASVAAAQAK